MTDFNYLEWEILQNSITSSTVNSAPGIIPLPDKITISRGHDFKIKIKASRQGATYHESAFTSNFKAGEVIQGKDIDITTKGNVKIVLHDVIQKGSTTAIRTDGTVDVDIKLSCSRISFTYDKVEKTNHIFQYMLGCPDHYMFPSGTKRNYDANNTLERKSISTKDYSFSHASKNMGFANDHVLITTDFGEAILSKSPVEDKETQNLRPCYLHFSDESKFLEKENRDAWIEAISFVFGKKLISIGHSFFDKKGYPVEKHSYTPYVANFEREVLMAELPPTSIMDAYGYCEVKISNLVNLYLKNREILNLNEVMWNFWTAEQMPLGMNFVCYSSALEKLIEAWFIANQEKQATKYLSSQDYKAVISLSLTEIEKRITEKDWAILKNRMHIPNELSLAEKKRRFFESLGLEVGDVEEKLMNARNLYAHGQPTIGNKNTELLALKRAFEALINRCILRCLEFQGNYFDYSAFGFPLHPISEKLRGRDS